MEFGVQGEVAATPADARPFIGGQSNGIRSWTSASTSSSSSSLVRQDDGKVAESGLGSGARGQMSGKSLPPLQIPALSKSTTTGQLEQLMRPVTPGTPALTPKMSRPPLPPLWSSDRQQHVSGAGGSIIEREMDAILAKGAGSLVMPVTPRTDERKVTAYEMAPANTTLGADDIRRRRLLRSGLRVVGVTWNLHRSIPSPEDFQEILSTRVCSSSGSLPPASDAEPACTLLDGDVLFIGVQEAGAPSSKPSTRHRSDRKKRRSHNNSKTSVRTAKTCPAMQADDKDVTCQRAGSTAKEFENQTHGHLPWYRVLEGVLKEHSSTQKHEADVEAGDGTVYYDPHQQPCTSGGRPPVDSYVLIDFVSLMGIQAAVYAKASLCQSISKVERYRLPTGILNIVGNKGAVGLSITIEDDPLRVGSGSSYLFINSHFQAHKHKVKQRNNDYRRIKSRLALNQIKQQIASPVPSQKNRIQTSPLASPSCHSEGSDGAHTDSLPSSPQPPGRVGVRPPDEDGGAGGIGMTPSSSSSRSSSSPSSPFLSEASWTPTSQRSPGDIRDPVDITDNFDFVMWLGDFNYRFVVIWCRCLYFSCVCRPHA